MAVQHFEHMPDGMVLEGLVERVVRDEQVYYAIQDGGFWHHPKLRGFVGQMVEVHLNREQNRLELRGWGNQAFITDLPDEDEE